jgi:hypothetical protein
MANRTYYHNEDKKIIFLSVPKNASKSVKDTLLIKYKVYGFEKRPLDNLANIDFSEYTKLAVVRNPLFRFISAYLHILTHIKGSENWSEEELLNNFRAAVNHLITKDNWSTRTVDFNLHYLTQCAFLSCKYLKVSNDEKKLVEIDQYIVIENIDRDWMIFAKRFKLSPQKISFHNRATNPRFGGIIYNYLFHDGLDYLHKINSWYENDWQLYMKVIRSTSDGKIMWCIKGLLDVESV